VIGSVPFAYVAIDHSHSQQPVPRGFPLFKICANGHHSCDIRNPFKDVNRILLVLVYKPPEIKFSVVEWNELFDSIDFSGISNSIIIMGDFNAQFSDWGFTRNNYAEVILNDFLMQSPFILLNDGSGTRISANMNYKSCLDITLVKSRTLISYWAIGEDSIGSDHLSIDIIIESNKYSDNSVNLNFNRTKLSLAKLDKHLLNELISQQLSQLNLGENGSHYNKWYNTIIESGS